MNSHTKKGQTEIFGLAIIVILISIGFFMFVSFRTQQKVETPQIDFTSDKLANDFVLSILEVNIRECSSFTIKDLVVDCARDKKIECAGKNSCKLLNDTVTHLLDETFVKTNMKFRFFSENILDEQGNELFNVSSRNCRADSRQGQRGSAIISLYPQPKTAYLNMNICYN